MKYLKYVKRHIQNTLKELNGEIIAFKQTGVGSECDNVIEIGNLDIALKSMDSILDDDINVNYKEAETTLDDMNKKVGKIK